MPYEIKLYDALGVEIELVTPLWRVREIDGLGMPDVRHVAEQYAQQNGETWLATWLGPRVVLLNFLITATTEAAMWQAREQILRLAKTFTAGFALEITLPTGAVRRLNLRYRGELSLPRNLSMPDRHQAVTLQCVAHDPTYYDPRSVLWAFAVSGGGEGDFGFPLGFPAGFGASTAAGIPEAKQYSGTWRAYPVITLRGPMVKPTITNHTTGEVLEFVDGYQIDEGETVILDLRPGVKTVTHSVDGNAPDALTDDSDLGTWHIAEHPDAIDGINSISVAFTGGNINTRAEIRFFTRYIGI